MRNGEVRDALMEEMRMNDSCGVEIGSVFQRAKWRPQEAIQKRTVGYSQHFLTSTAMTVKSGGQTFGVVTIFVGEWAVLRREGGAWPIVEFLRRTTLEYTTHPFVVTIGSPVMYDTRNPLSTVAISSLFLVVSPF